MPVELWFQDEARVGQKGSLSYIWSAVGSRPPMVRDNRHDTAYLFGAICPACAVVWNWFISDADRVQSIGTREWATVSA